MIASCLAMTVRVLPPSAKNSLVQNPKPAIQIPKFRLLAQKIITNHNSFVPRNDRPRACLFC
jgi:hypothetical protein